MRNHLRSAHFARMMFPRCRGHPPGRKIEQVEKRGKEPMNFKTKLALGVLTALAMLALTFAIPRGGPVRDAQLVQFPMTVGVWAIFVLLFVKLK